MALASLKRTYRRFVAALKPMGPFAVIKDHEGRGLTRIDLRRGGVTSKGDRRRLIAEAICYYVQDTFRGLRPDLLMAGAS